MSRTPSTRSVLAASALAFALPSPPTCRRPMTCPPRVRLPAHAMKAGAHGAMHHGGGEHFGGGRAMMRGLDLTEEQRDKLVCPASCPGAGNACEDEGDPAESLALRELTMSDQYDEAKAQALADQGAKAMGEVAMLRAKMGNAFYKVLTPAQREKLKQRMAATATVVVISTATAVRERANTAWEIIMAKGVRAWKSGRRRERSCTA
ncbi:MAG: Spy/CpxP family protein refolding chaperone [Burkholderiaceae bacterium]